MKKPKFKYRSTKRIYYGAPGAETSRYWTVEVSPATQEVSINGNVLDALKSQMTPPMTRPRPALEVSRRNPLLATAKSGFLILMPAMNRTDDGPNRAALRSAP